MSAASKIYNINVTVQVKRSKDELDFAKTESEKLHSLIATDKQVEWAKQRIESIHQMVFLPAAEQIKGELTKHLKDDETASDV